MKTNKLSIAVSILSFILVSLTLRGTTQDYIQFQGAKSELGFIMMLFLLGIGSAITSFSKIAK